eukprot:5287505-Pyramimonas_sp.AAC.1
MGTIFGAFVDHFRGDRPDLTLAATRGVGGSPRRLQKPCQAAPGTLPRLHVPGGTVWRMGLTARQPSTVPNIGR